MGDGGRGCVSEEEKRACDKTTTTDTESSAAGSAACFSLERQSLVGCQVGRERLRTRGGGITL